MPTIKIAHLYYDLMNLYGENGNIRVLKKHLENQDLNVDIHFLTIDDEIDFQKYDVFYIGSGSNESFNLVLNDIMKYKEKIKNAIEEKKFFIITGNALNLFGINFKNNNNEKIPCLNILNYTSEHTIFRIVGEQIIKMKNLDKILIGFQNRDTILKNVFESPLFDVLDGTGFYPQNNYEGIKKNNFYGTYLLGPILARNPHFTELIVQEITKTYNITYKKITIEFEEKAYQEYLNYYKQKNN